MNTQSNPSHNTPSDKRGELKQQILEMITPGSAWTYSGNMTEGLKTCDYTAEKIMALIEQEIAEARIDELYTIDFDKEHPDLFNERVQALRTNQEQPRKEEG